VINEPQYLSRFWTLIILGTLALPVIACIALLLRFL
jgi:hypothetical protein